MVEPTSPEDTTNVAPKVPDYPPLSPAVPSPASKGAKGGAGRALGIGLLVALLGFGGGVAGFFAADEWLDDEPGAASGTQPLQPSNRSVDEDPLPVTDTDGTLSPREIYRTVSPAVVHINARVVQTSTSFFGFQQEQEAVGTGSGFLIDDDGHIVTNAHVVADAKDLEVSFGNDAKVPAKLVGADPSTDIAVIKIDPDAKELDAIKGGLKQVGFGDSEAVQVGDPVIAIGNPFSLDRTLTTGVVSALQREIPALNEFQIDDVIQTDAAVNPGNSGGPLLNMAGDVIGVNSQIQSRGGGFDGIAFAVPSSTAKRVATQLIKSGKVEYAWLGVSGGELTPEVAKQYDLDIEEGVLVGTVTQGSPADKAGLRGGTVQRSLTGQEVRSGGDVIVSADGKKLTTMRELADLVDAKKPGDEMLIVYIHDGKRETTRVELGVRPTESPAEQ